MIYIFGILAVCLMLLGHILKALRWSEFVWVYERPARTNLFYALSCGHIINAIVPFRLGDFVRMWISGRKMQNGYALSIATVFIDVYLDVCTVCCFWLLFALTGKGDSTIHVKAGKYGLILAILLTGSILCYMGRDQLKKMIQKFSMLFNQTIELTILYISWSMISCLKDIITKLNRAKFLMLTAGMWIAYLMSYWAFAKFLTLAGIKKDFYAVFGTLFSYNRLQIFNLENIRYSVWLLLFLLFPLLILMIYTKTRRCMLGNKEESDRNRTYEKMIPHLNETERLTFLENYFSGSSKEYIRTYLRINHGVSVVRDYSAGSNATTILCIDEKQTFYRKYVIGKDKDKLQDQIDWLKKYQDKLPLPTILREEQGENYCVYDMEYHPEAVPFFQYIHSVSVDEGWSILKKALECLNRGLYRTTEKPWNEDAVEQYIEKKVYHNLQTIQSDSKCLHDLWEYDTLVINGTTYKNFKFYEKWFEKDNLKHIFSNDVCCEIHGDLTIENIIGERAEERTFYFIDPNTGNLHESKALDYAKLLQSLHGGYEFLMAVSNYEIKGNEIRFFATRSMIYEQIYKKFDSYLRSIMTPEEVRSVYFHEVIHFLRLLPYKIQKDGKKAGVFYAQMIIILHDILEMFGGEQ